MTDTIITPISTRSLSDKPRTTSVTLDWPVEVNGQAYYKIGLKRLTVGEVASFVDYLKENPDAKDLRFPIFTDETGALPESSVLDALDDGDGARLMEAARAFLPQRFQPDPPPQIVPSPNIPPNLAASAPFLANL